VAEEWRKVHIEELSDFYSSQNAIREIKWGIRQAANLACMGQKENTCTIFMGKPKKMPLERHWRKWEDYNKMKLQEMTMGQAVDCCKQGDEHSGFHKMREISESGWENVSFTRSTLLLRVS
jgi:hypothetical protein